MTSSSQTGSVAPVGNERPWGVIAEFDSPGKILKAAKGYRGRASRSFRVAIRRVERARQNAYRDRKLKKREFRRLWIQRLNAGVRQHGIRYSRWIKMQREGGVGLDRKVLSGLAMHEPFSFKAVVDVVKARSAA